MASAADASDRASDAVDFLQSLGLPDGVNEDDLISSTGRAPLRECVASLGVALVGAFEAAARARRCRLSSSSSFPSSSAFAASPGLANAAARLRAAARDPSRPGKHIDACLLSLEEAAARAEREEEAGGEEGGEEEAAGATPTTAAKPDASSSEEAKAAPPATPPRLELVERLAARVCAARLEALAGVSKEGEQNQPMEEDEKKKTSSSAAATAAASSALRRLGRLLGCGASSFDDRALSLATCSAAAAQKIASSLPEGLEAAKALDKSEFSERQLATLAAVDGALREEYRLRRRLLAGRAEVTLRALLASPRLASGDAKVLKSATEAAERALESMGGEPAVENPEDDEGAGAGGRVWDVSAGDVLKFGAKTSATQARRPSDALSLTSSASEDSSLAAVKRVVVAAVPDRGGRVNEPRGGGGKGGAGPAFSARVEGSGGGGRYWKHSEKHKIK